MPGYKGHLFGSSIAYLIILYFFYYWFNPSLLTMLEWGIFTSAGALFPDIDVKSKGQHLFYIIIFFIFLILLIHDCYKIVACLSIFVLIPLLVAHRTLFHRTWFIIALPCLVGLVVMHCMPNHADIIFMDVFFFIVGALTHLWLDLGFRMFK